MVPSDPPTHRSRLHRPDLRQPRHRRDLVPARPLHGLPASRRHQSPRLRPRHLKVPPHGRQHGRHGGPGLRPHLPVGPAIADPGLHLRSPQPVLQPHVRPLGRHGTHHGRPQRDARRHPVGLHSGLLHRP